MGKIIGTGMVVPEIIIWIEVISDNPDWVFKNIGIRERRTGSTTLELAYMAGQMAMINAGLKNVDMIIIATATPEMVAPSTAAQVARDLNQSCPAFDINAVCSGFLYGMIIANSFLQGNTANILLIGVDTFSKITDYSDRNCVFFGDGAGAIVMTNGFQMIKSYWNCDPSDQGFTCKTGGTFEMNGRKVYEAALKLVPEAISEVLKSSGITIDEIDYMVPHQPSKRILMDIADKIGLSREKVLMNMEKYANTSAATIPILLHESWSKFKKGDKILFASIGSGWTYGAMLYQV